MAKAKGS